MNAPKPPDPPLAAILRGLEPDRATEVARTLFDAGFRVLEVPLNRPGALQCIASIAASAPAGALIGGGTMLTRGDVDAVHDAGGRLMVAPNANPAVIGRAVERGMLAMPGIATPTEAFAAIDAGAHVFKLFPAEVIGVAGLKAMRAVLPGGVPLWPVGGITVESIAPWMRAGAAGFGIGSQLFQPGVSLDTLAQTARAFVAAWRRETGG